MKYKTLPCAKLVEKGLLDLSEQPETVESLLVKIISPNLVRSKIISNIPEGKDHEIALYEMLSPYGLDAYNQYKSLISRVDKFVSYL